MDKITRIFALNLKCKVMDIFNLIIGIVLGFIIGLFVKRVLLIFQIILSICTSFIFVRIFIPDLELLSIYEWTWYNLFNGENYYALTIIGLLLSAFIFYWIFPKLIIHFIVNRNEVKADNLFRISSQLELNSLKSTTDYLCAKIAVIIQKVEWGKKRKIEANHSYNYFYDEYINTLVISLTTFIHLIISWIIFIPINFWFVIFIVIIIAIMFAMIFYIPYANKLMSYIKNTIINEYNRNIE